MRAHRCVDCRVASVPQPLAAVAVGVVGSGVVLSAAVKAKSVREGGAGIDLWNALVDSQDPTVLRPEVVKGINEKYGLNMATTQLAEVQQTYSAYLQSLIPQGKN